MSILVAVAAAGVRLPMSRARVARIARAVFRAERVTQALLSITFVSNRGIRALNRKHLQRNRLTDVIAFGFRSAGRESPVVGDVYIGADVARASAAANGIAFHEELARLVVHGALHVLGYDHPENEARTRSPMWKKQERLVARVS